MAFNFKKALAFTLAAAMVVTAAPSASITADAAAKKPSITASKTINADKTASIKVNTVKKGRFIKITSISKASNVTIKAKINGKNTKLKKNKYYKVTGKSVTLKVTGADSIADYTSTIKVSVFDKKGKKYNVVKPKNLTAKVKVKASEFSIVDVVSTTAGLAATGSKYVRATFSKAIDSLDASEVEITDKATGQIYSIEKVTLSSNKKVAEVALTGDNSVAGTTFLKANVDYIFKITKAGVTGQFEFSIPAVDENVVIAKVDPAKKTITGYQISVNTTNNSDFAAAKTFNIPSSITVDYQELLGTTRHISYDKTNTVTKIAETGTEKVVYGAFEAKNKDKNDKDVYLYDPLTETKYYTQDTASGSIPRTNHVDYNTGAGNWAARPSADKYDSLTAANSIKTDEANSKTYAYGKLVLNPGGSIRSFYSVDKWGGVLVVDSVSGNIVKSKDKKEQNVEGYTLLKDGKTITAADIKSGDMLFYNTSYKLAEVYNNSISGDFEAVYDDGFKMGGKNYTINANADTVTNYINSSNESKKVDSDYLKAVKAAGKGATVYLNRFGNPVYITGEQAAAVTTSSKIVLTAAADGYVDKKDNIIEFKGFDGTAVVTKTVNVDDLSIVKLNENGTETKWDKKNGAITATGFDNKSTADNIIFNGTNWDITKKFAQFSVVEFTADDKGKITEINVKVPIACTATEKFDGKNDAAFKTGYKTLGNYTIASDVDVYVIKTIDKNVVGEKLTYGTFASSVARKDVGYVKYLYDSGKITTIVIDNVDGTALGTDDDGSTKSEVVIKEIRSLGDKVSSLTVINNGTEKSYSKFSSITSTKKAGDIVEIKVLKDGETVDAIGDVDVVSTADVGNVDTSARKVKIFAGGVFTEYKLSDSATLAKKDAAGDISIISLAEFASLSATLSVNYSLLGTSDTIDTVLVTANRKTASATNNAAALETLINGCNYINTCAAYVSSAGGTKYAPINSKVDYELAAAEQKKIADAVTAYDGVSGNSFTKDVSATVQNLYTLMNAGILDAQTYLIVGESLVTASTTVKTAGGSSTTAGSYIVAKLPTDFYVTLAGGSAPKSITVSKAWASTDTNVETQAGSFVLSGGAGTVNTLGAITAPGKFTFVLTQSAIGSYRLSNELLAGQGSNYGVEITVETSADGLG